MMAPGKKVLAVAAVLLLAHVQVAWACSDMLSMDMSAMERADCCIEHDSHCESDPLVDGLCMEPLTAGTPLALLPAPTDFGDDGVDASGVDNYEFTSAAFFARRLSTGPPAPFRPDYHSRAAQLTYLETLRLRI